MNLNDKVTVVTGGLALPASTCKGDCVFLLEQTEAIMGSLISVTGRV
jgi:hypothetical protein